MEAVSLKMEGKTQSIIMPDTMRFTDADLCAAKIDDAVIIMPRKSIQKLMHYGFNSFTSDIFSEGRVLYSSTDE